MRPVQKFHGLAIRVVGALSIAAFAAILVATMWNPQHLLKIGPALITLSYIVYVAMWRPYVEVSDSGVRLRNVIQMVHIPWPAIQKVSARWSLTITSARGSHSAWALPATPSGHAPRLTREDSARSDATAVGFLIEERREELSDAGYLSTPAARGLEATVETDKPTVTIVTVGLVISIIALFLG